MRVQRRVLLMLMLMLMLSAQSAQAGDECPFLRDPAYWARTPVAAAPAGELAVATLNVYRLFDDEQDDRESTRLSTAQLQDRIRRLARYVANDLGAPAVLGLQEVEDDTVLRLLAAALTQQTGRGYRFVAGEKRRAPISAARCWWTTGSGSSARNTCLPLRLTRADHALTGCRW